MSAIHGVAKHLTKIRNDKLIKMAQKTNRRDLIRQAAENALPRVDWKAVFSEDPEATYSRAPDIQVAIQRVQKTSPKATADEVKGFLLTMGYDPLKVKQGIKVRDDKLIIRGSLKDTLDYEFYGNPKGTWPNVRRLRNWVRTVVIPTNPQLKKEYAAVTRDRPAREGMLQDLTYVIGRSIFKNGLQKKSHWYYEKAEELRLAHQSDGDELLAKYKGIDIPKMSSRTGHGGVSRRWQR